MENALLRERINDVAAEVARLTAVLEGPGSPIESMLAVEAAAASGMATAQPAMASERRRRRSAMRRRARARSPTASARCRSSASRVAASD